MDFEEWYRSAFPKLAASLVLVGWNSEFANDAASEACARALERWPRVAAMSSPDAWAYRVAINVLRRQLRRDAIERRLLPRLVQRTSVEPVEIDPRVEEAVRELPRRQREAIALRYVFGMRQHEAAEALGVSPGTVASTLHAARNRLRAALGMEDRDTRDDQLSEVE